MHPDSNVSQNYIRTKPFKILQILKIGNSTLQFSYQSPSTPSNSPPENPRDRHLVLPNLVGSEYMESHHYLPPKKSNLGRKSHGSENLRFQALYICIGDFPIQRAGLRGKCREIQHTLSVCGLVSGRMQINVPCTECSAIPEREAMWEGELSFDVCGTAFCLLVLFFEWLNWTR